MRSAVTFSLLFFLPGQLLAGDKPIVAVFNVEVKNMKIPRQERDALSDYLSNKMAGTGLYQIVPRDQIKKRLSRAKSKSYKKCYDQSCQVELGRELAAQMTLSARVMKLGSRCTVALTLYDLKRVTTEAASTVKGKCGMDEIVNSMDKAVDDLPKSSAEMKAEADSRAAEAAKRSAEKTRRDREASLKNDLVEGVRLVNSKQKEDNKKGIGLLSNACSGNLMEACFRLGIAFNLGLTAPKDVKRAAKLFEKACIGGHANGCWAFAVALEQGEGLDKNADMARRLFENTCNKEHALSCRNLGLMYRDGRSVEKSPEKAVRLIRKACDLGDKLSCSLKDLKDPFE